ncbi:MAG: CDP-alcohol phosphatidyltransferase family protein [Ruminococcaceae bacterium]|nr:CDP-alcohol phosphatidyltransferase family protein [Oscillospiraceae bacterium]
MKQNRSGANWIRHLPNIITSLRLVGAACMIFTRPFSKWFFILYALCGFSDLLDGWIARATNNTSALGATLDSIADLSFNSVMLLKIFPTLWKRLPLGIWITVAIIIALRIVSYTVFAVKHRGFASLHTYLNKLTGFAVFTIPFYINLSCSTVLAAIGCTISGLATVEELLIHLFRKEPVKTIFAKGSNKD